MFSRNDAADTQTDTNTICLTDITTDYWLFILLLTILIVVVVYNCH